jgi:hypothetical protein
MEKMTNVRGGDCCDSYRTRHFRSTENVISCQQMCELYEAFPPPASFPSSLLKEVSLHLPAGTSMPTKLAVEKMYVY